MSICVCGFLCVCVAVDVNVAVYASVATCVCARVRYCCRHYHYLYLFVCFSSFPVSSVESLAVSVMESQVTLTVRGDTSPGGHDI